MLARYGGVSSSLCVEFHLIPLFKDQNWLFRVFVDQFNQLLISFVINEADLTHTERAGMCAEV